MEKIKMTKKKETRTEQRKRVGLANMNLWVPAEMVERITELAAANRRSRTQEVVMAIERYLAAVDGDAVVYDCAGGFDSYEPDNEGQVPDCAAQLAAEIEAGYTVPPRRGAEGRKR